MIRAVRLTTFLLMCFVVATFAHQRHAVKAKKPQSPIIEVSKICLKKKFLYRTQKELDELMRRLEFKKENQSLCGGHFKNRKIPYQSTFTARADDATLLLKGRSTLRGHIKVGHQHRRLQANTAHIYRQGGEVKRIELIDNVVIYEPNHFIRAERADLNPKDYSGLLQDVLYRFTLVGDDNRQTTVWGRACMARREPSGDVYLKQVTYSTCAPNQLTWYVRAKEIELHHKESYGVARDATLYFYQKPFVYLPYLSFPLNTKRKSGFLASELGFTSQNGLDWQVPFYLNLTNNMDATLMPHYFSYRGMMMGGEFRYLFGETQGLIEGHFLPSDKAFDQFKQSNLWLAPSLRFYADNRYSYRWQQDSTFFERWHLDIDYQRVSDDYYLQDFNNNLATLSDNQLLQRFALSYESLHWRFLGLFQSYQTLHPFNQSQVLDVYSTLPSLQLEGNYYGLPYDFFVNLVTRLDRFTWNGFNANVMPQGYRYHFNPTVGIDKRLSWGFIKPQLSVFTTYYDLSRYNRAHQRLKRLLPVVSIDTGLYLDKEIFNGSITQTLEPRFFYLFTPYVKQSTIPVFDTGFYIPSFNQLFRINEFAGIDRISNANDVSFGLTSRFFYNATGKELLRLSIGGRYRFESQRVSLCQDFSGGVCRDNPLRLAFARQTRGLAPAQGEAEFALSNHISLLANGAYDIKANHLNNGLVNFHYEPKTNHIINTGYAFINKGDPRILPTNVVNNTNLHQIRLSYAWPFNAHWRSLGAFSYNISHNFPMSYLFGLQYDNCCMALRFLTGRIYRFYSPQGQPKYGNNVYLQLLLKGLGSAATNDPNSVILNYLPNFRDEFKRPV